MAKLRYGSRAQASYDWTPEVAYPYGKGRKPCNQSDPNFSYPDDADEDGIAEALFACGLCDAREACLAEALKHSVSNDFGIWGGTTPAQRRSLRRQSKQVNPTPECWPRPSWTRYRPRWAGPSLCLYAA